VIQLQLGQLLPQLISLLLTLLLPETTKIMSFYETRGNMNTTFFQRLFQFENKLNYFQRIKIQNLSCWLELIDKL
jgi:hypothetical protein